MFCIIAIHSKISISHSEAVFSDSIASCLRSGEICHSGNPLEAGQSFRRSIEDFYKEFRENRSQSPRSGAIFPFEHALNLKPCQEVIGGVRKICKEVEIDGMNKKQIMM